MVASSSISKIFVITVFCVPFKNILSLYRKKLKCKDKRHGTMDNITRRASELLFYISDEVVMKEWILNLHNIFIVNLLLTYDIILKEITSSK